MAGNSASINKQWLNDLATAFTRIDEPAAMRQFIEEIFTPAERRDISLRWRLMQMLRDGVPQRRIAKELGISLCKITRGSKVLKNEQAIVSRLLKSEKEELNT